MLQAATFKVTLDDGSGVEVTASAPDYAAYEERFDKSAPLSMDRYTFYMFVIWHAMHRQKLTELSWDDWLASAPTFDRDVESEEPAPLEPTPPIGSSQDLPLKQE